MKNFRMWGRKEINKTMRANNEKEAAVKFYDKYKIIPVEVGNRRVVSCCEGCNIIIFDDENYVCDAEGCYLCENCSKEL